MFYISVTADDVAEARDLLGEQFADTRFQLVHSEPPTEEGEQGSFIFGCNAAMPNDFEPTIHEMLHDHYTLPNLTNAPLVQLEDFQ